MDSKKLPKMYVAGEEMCLHLSVSAINHGKSVLVIQHSLEESRTDELKGERKLVRVKANLTTRDGEMTVLSACSLGHDRIFVIVNAELSAVFEEVRPVIDNIMDENCRGLMFNRNRIHYSDLPAEKFDEAFAFMELAS